MWSPDDARWHLRAHLYWRLLCLSSCFVDPHPDSGRVGRRYEDLGRLGRGFRAPTFILPLAALPPSSWSAAFALLERRAGSRRASHPSPPPSGHQSTNLPASKRALKALQRMLTTLNGHYVRLGSQSSPVGASPLRSGRTFGSTGSELPSLQLYVTPAPLYFLMRFQSTSKARGLWWCEHDYPRCGAHTRDVQAQLPRARRTGFYHGVGAPQPVGSGPSFAPVPCRRVYVMY